METRHVGARGKRARKDRFTPKSNQIECLRDCWALIFSFVRVLHEGFYSCWAVIQIISRVKTVLQDYFLFFYVNIAGKLIQKMNSANVGYMHVRINRSYTHTRTQILQNQKSNRHLVGRELVFHLPSMYQPFCCIRITIYAAEVTIRQALATDTHLLPFTHTHTKRAK